MKALGALLLGETWARTSYEITLVIWLQENGDTATSDSMLSENVERVHDAWGAAQAQLVQRLTDLILQFRIHERGTTPLFPMDDNAGVATNIARGEHGAYARLCNEITQLRRP